MALYGAMSLWRMPFYFEMRSPVPGWWKSLEVGEKIWSLYTKKCRSIPYFSCTKPMSLFPLISGYVVLMYQITFRPIRWRIRFQLPRKPTGQGFLDQQNNLMRQDDMASQISRPARSLPARYDMAAPVAQLVACRTRCERRIYAQSESWAELEAKGIEEFDPQNGRPFIWHWNDWPAHRTWSGRVIALYGTQKIPPDGRRQNYPLNWADWKGWGSGIGFYVTSTKVLYLVPDLTAISKNHSD